MPVEFLSDDQVAAYERFVGDLTRSELEGFFLLDATALDLIAHKRGEHNRAIVRSHARLKLVRKRIRRSPTGPGGSRRQGSGWWFRPVAEG